MRNDARKYIYYFIDINQNYKNIYCIANTLITNKFAHINTMASVNGTPKNTVNNRQSLGTTWL